MEFFLSNCFWNIDKKGENSQDYLTVSFLKNIFQFHFRFFKLIILNALPRIINFSIVYPRDTSNDPSKNRKQMRETFVDRSILEYHNDQEEEEERRSSFGYARTGCFYFQKGNRREATLEEKKRGLASFQQK